jgi:hypothetical protein
VSALKTRKVSAAKLNSILKVNEADADSQPVNLFVIRLGLSLELLDSL